MTNRAKSKLESSSVIGGVDASGTEAGGATLGVTELLDLLEHRMADLLAYQLGDAVADLHLDATGWYSTGEPSNNLKVLVAEVEQENLELPAVVSVHHTRS